MAEIHYVATGYVAPAFYQTGLSVDWAAKVIHVPKMFLTYVGPNAYSLDTNAFRLALRDIEDGEAGVAFSPTHNHNTTVTLAGVEYARVIEILSPYTITFEDGQYSVNLIGSNNNIGDKANINQVSVRVNNSAGLQNVSTPTNVVTGTALTAEETANAVWQAVTRTLTSGTTSAFSTPLAYKASSTTTAADPGAGRIRWDNATQASATALYMDTETDNGLDISNYVGGIAAGATLYVQDRNSATVYQRWLITSVTDNTGWVTFGVTLMSASGGNIANNAQSVVLFSSSAVPVAANVKMVNDVTVVGSGTTVDPWNPA